MEQYSGPTGANRRACIDETRLNHAFDAGLFSGPSHRDNTKDEDDLLNYESDGDSTSLTTGLSASLRFFSESMMRIEQAESEMVKRREDLRLKAEKRRIESEAELTQMLLRTQLQIASFASRQSQIKKRKRDDSGEVDETASLLSQR